ncbi:MAG: immunoglobulin domain-containing protein [Verrucomicrobia bacterium]|nr:immunoglobulin domain-containing protein [Verrucomicrobiota bacterium]
MTRRLCFTMSWVWLVIGAIHSPFQTLADTVYRFSTFAGVAGQPGSADGIGTLARFDKPDGVAVDSGGNVYVADLFNHTIRMITSGGVVSTVAGLAGNPGSVDGPGSVARFRSPSGVAADGAGNVYVADGGNHTIRKITLGGAVSTLAGSAGVNGITDGPGIAARFDLPSDVSLDGAGNVFVADLNNNRIRKLTPDGVVSTLAGSVQGFSDGTGSEARFFLPGGVVVDSQGNVYVGDNANHTIRRITPVGVVGTLAGLEGVSGPVDGTGSATRFNSPWGLAVDTTGNLYVADLLNHTIRMITPRGEVSTVAGWAGEIGSADGTGNAARFNRPYGVAVDSIGNLYVADTGNNTIRKGIPVIGPTIISQPQSQMVTMGTTVTFTVKATGSPPLIYEWRKNVARIEGATNETLTFDNVQSSDAGSYSVLVSNAAGGVTSSNATLMLNVVSKLLGTFDPSRYDTVLVTGNGIHAAEGRTSLAQAYAGRIFYSISSDGSERPAKVYSFDPTTTNNVPGLTELAGQFLALSSMGGQLFVSHSDGVIWKYDGTIFTPVRATPFNPSNYVRAMAQFNGKMYFGTSAGRIYESSDGYQFRFNTAIDSGGPNKLIVAMTEWKGHLYVATSEEISRSSELFRTVDGINWSLVRGFQPFALQGFVPTQDYLYASSVMIPDRVVVSLGLWSTTNGVDWTLPFVDPRGSKGVAGRSDYFSQTGRAYFLSLWNGVIRMFPASEGKIESPFQMAHGFSSVVELDGRLYGIGAQTPNDWAQSPYVISLLGDYAVPVSITVQPQSQTVLVDSDVTFSVAATGTLPLSYQWRRDRVDIIGATNSTLVLKKVQKPESGTYGVVVSNLVGSAASTDAKLEVNDPVIVRFSQDSFQTNESAGVLKIPVLRTGNSVASVSYAVSDRTAVPGRDYLLEPGRLDFARNEDTKEIRIRLLDNFVLDRTRELTISLSSPSNGAMLGAPSIATVSITDDEVPAMPTSFMRLVPPNARTASGALRVTIEAPAAERGGWRLPWELVWHSSGQTLGNLDVGNYAIQFRPIAGFDEPPAAIIPVLNKEVTGRIARYASRLARDSGSLIVMIEPPEVHRLDAGWRLRGELGYLPSGYPWTGLPAGATNIIECRPVRDWLTPPARLVTLVSGVDNIVRVDYEPAPPPGRRTARPVLSYAEIEDALATRTTLKRPLPLVGQLRTPLGWGSGIAVRKKVVLTATHVLFDDSTTNFVTSVEWFHERHAGDYESRPMRGLGWYVMDQYLIERRKEREQGLKPGVSSRASQQWDIAAIYFDQPVARDGESGFLLSDAEINEWLLGPEGVSGEKFLAGYPLTGEADGRMFETEARNYGFVPEGGCLYSTADFLSFPGNSGGPLFVLPFPATNRTYFPAAVYLGSHDGRSTVRAIDSRVADLINRAASSADLGTNFTGGGVFVFNSPIVGAATFGFQTLSVTLEPAAAVTAGAAWHLKEIPSMEFTNAVQASRILPTGVDYSLEFKPVPGYQTPKTTTINLVAGQDQAYRASYGWPPILRFNPAQSLELLGALDWKYAIEIRHSLELAEPWRTLRTLTLTNSPQTVPLTVQELAGQAFLRAILLPPE